MYHNHIAEHYISKSIWLAALLDARHVPFKEAVPVDAHRCVFKFLNEANWAYDVARQFYDEPEQATASVPALAASYRKMLAASREAREAQQRGTGEGVAA